MPGTTTSCRAAGRIHVGRLLDGCAAPVKAAKIESCDPCDEKLHSEIFVTRSAGAVGAAHAGGPARLGGFRGGAPGL